MTITILQDRIEKLERIDKDSMKEDGVPVFSFYPNPTNGAVVFDLKPNKHFSSSIEVIDLNGQTIKSIDVTNKANLSIDSSSMNRGAYFVRYFVDGKLIETRRLVVGN